MNWFQILNKPTYDEVITTVCSNSWTWILTSFVKSKIQGRLDNSKHGNHEFLIDSKNHLCKITTPYLVV